MSLRQHTEKTRLYSATLSYPYTNRDTLPIFFFNASLKHNCPCNCVCLEIKETTPSSLPSACHKAAQRNMQKMMGIFSVERINNTGSSKFKNQFHFPMKKFHMESQITNRKKANREQPRKKLQ